jgi:hypothetical protein
VTAPRTRLSQNGKAYPASRPTRQERGRAIRVAHQLVHDRHLSIRAAQKVMAETYGIRRSVGIIARDLADFECPACREVDG